MLVPATTLIMTYSTDMFDGFLASLITIFVLSSSVTAQSLTASEGEIEGLWVGNSYTLDPHPGVDTSVTPITTGFESGTPAVFVLSGAPGTSWKIQFLLPKSLSACDQSISCSFSSNSILWQEHDIQWNPNLPRVLTLDSGGAATLDLGISVMIPDKSQTMEFDANVTCIAIDMQ